MLQHSQRRTIHRNDSNIVFLYEPHKVMRTTDSSTVWRLGSYEEAETESVREEAEKRCGRLWEDDTWPASEVERWSCCSVIQLLHEDGRTSMAHTSQVMPDRWGKGNVKYINNESKQMVPKPQDLLKQLTIGNRGLWQLCGIRSHLYSQQMGDAVVMYMSRAKLQMSGVTYLHFKLIFSTLARVTYFDVQPGLLSKTMT